MRKTLEAVEARAGTAIEARRGEPVYERLQPTLGIMRAALDAALVLARGHTPDPSVELALVQTLHAALDRGYQAGQLLAMPELLASPGRTVPPVTRAPHRWRSFVPGDPAFDPWCLTDPIERRRLASDCQSVAKLDDFWAKHPEVEQLLALQSRSWRRSRPAPSTTCPGGRRVAEAVHVQVPMAGSALGQGPDLDRRTGIRRRRPLRSLGRRRRRAFPLRVRAPVRARSRPVRRGRRSEEPPGRARVGRGSAISSGARSRSFSFGADGHRIAAAETFDLLDWKRRIFALYAEIRVAPEPEGPGGPGARFATSCSERTRPHRSREERASYPGVPCFDYDPALRVVAAVEPVEPSHADRQQRNRGDCVRPVRGHGSSSAATSSPSSCTG